MAEIASIVADTPRLERVSKHLSYVLRHQLAQPHEHRSGRLQFWRGGAQRFEVVAALMTIAGV